MNESVALLTCCSFLSPFSLLGNRWKTAATPPISLLWLKWIPPWGKACGTMGSFYTHSPLTIQLTLSSPRLVKSLLPFNIISYMSWYHRKGITNLFLLIRSTSFHLLFSKKKKIIYLLITVLGFRCFLLLHISSSRHVGFSSCGSQAWLPCGIFLDQGSNLCPLP